MFFRTDWIVLVGMFGVPEPLFELLLVLFDPVLEPVPEFELLFGFFDDPLFEHLEPVIR